MPETNPEAAYWNEAGGERWVANIDRVESMLEVLNPHLFARAAPTAGEHVLDIGCGGGVTSAAIADRVGPSGSVLGADISAPILAVARSRYPARKNLRFVTVDAGTHAFAPAGFDLVTSRFGVMFFPDPPAAFRNLRAATKPDGRLVFMCWQAIEQNPWMGVPVAAAFSVLPRPEKPDPDAPGPFSLADPDKLQRVLATAGFTGIVINPVQEHLTLGDPGETLDFMTKMGPAAEPLMAASDDERVRAVDAMREALGPFATPDGVVMPGAAWLVEAVPA